MSDENLSVPEGTTGVQLSINLEPAPQSRGSVFLRIILVIPHLFALAIMTIVLAFLHIASFITGVIFGRIPDGMQNTQVGILRYYANISAYLWLLSDEYPKFDVEPREDTIADLTVSHEKLSRLAVLFRGVLAIPAMIFSAVISLGNETLVIAAWFIALVKGELPPALHQAIATNLRTHIRYSAYILFLTPEQPWHGWRGDGEATEPGQGRTTNFLLSAGAQLALTLTLVFGLVDFVGGAVAVGGQVNAQLHVSDLRTAIDDSVVTATQSIIAFEGPNKTCKTAECRAVSAREQAAIFEATIKTLRSKHFPASVHDELGAYIDVLQQVDAYFVIISKTKAVPGQQYTFEKMLMPIGLQIYPAGATVTSAL